MEISVGREIIELNFKPELYLPYSNEWVPVVLEAGHHPISLPQVPI